MHVFPGVCVIPLRATWLLFICTWRARLERSTGRDPRICMWLAFSWETRLDYWSVVEVSWARGVLLLNNKRQRKWICQRNLCVGPLLYPCPFPRQLVYVISQQYAAVGDFCTTATHVLTIGVHVMSDPLSMEKIPCSRFSKSPCADLLIWHVDIFS